MKKIKKLGFSEAPALSESAGSPGEGIRNGKRKRATIKDIAAEAKVSIRTVSLALNNAGRISPATRKKVLGIAEEMNYQPNLAARGLVNNRTYLFGANFPRANLSFANSIIAGVEKKCIELNYELLLTSINFRDIAQVDNDIPVMKKSLERLLYRRVDGIISFPDRRVLKMYRKILDSQIPLIQILRSIPELPCPSIKVDNLKGTCDAACYLLGKGIERIGFLKYGNDKFEEAADRYRGYQKALEEWDRKADPEKLSVPCDLTVQGGYEAAMKLLRAAPKLEAIMAATDYAALGCMRACLEKKKKIPEEISIIGFDDMEFAAYQGYRPLSTVRQPKESLGILAVEHLYRMVNGETAPSVMLAPELVLRESSV
jgi:DNA-binding LacI/PurR family transcriptional regulator